MSAVLFCKTGELEGAEFGIADEATIGTDPRNSVVLSAKTISRRHAAIRFDSEVGAYFLEDLGSRNGTELDGSWVKGKEKLGDLHVITFANRYDFIFRHLESLAVAEAKDSDTLLGRTPIRAPEGTFHGGAGRFALPKFESHPSLEPQDEPAATDLEAPAEIRPGKWSLELTQDIDGKKAFELKQGENVVGRIGDCQILLNDERLSRRHAVLTVRGERVSVRDLGSTNGTMVRGKDATDDISLEPGDPIRFGSIEAKLLREDRGVGHE